MVMESKKEQTIISSSLLLSAFYLHNSNFTIFHRINEEFSITSHFSRSSVFSKSLLSIFPDEAAVSMISSITPGW